MRVKAGIIIIIISLLFLVGTVGAVGIPDTVIVTTDKPWIIANNVDQSTITVTVMNTTPGYSGVVPGVTVNLVVNNTIYGTLSPTTVTTDVSGWASSTFKAKTKSGAAQITVSGLSGSGIQNIDHDTPKFAFFSYLFTGEVATEVPFNITFTDQWGNKIDNRKEAALGLSSHTISLQVHGPSPDNCSFVGYGPGYVHDIFPALDSNGNVSVKIKLTSKTGSNNIIMGSFGSISDKFEYIEAVATGIPFSITGRLTPPGPIPANNIDTFTVDYFLYDVYGNPLNNKQINWTTSLIGDVGQGLKTSNSYGQIQFPYGPKITVNNVTLTAISIDNPSVKNVLYAEFSNAEATNIVLTVTPQIMISRDAKSTEQAFVRATVIDNFGNPVPNEPVSFSLGTVSAPGFTQTAPPTLSSTSATTGNDGNAIVIFYPGSFAKWGEPGYNGAATGNVVVTATWNGNPKSVTTTWKNYAFLNIQTSAVPQKVNVSGTVDITIDVIGDGPGLQGGNVAAIMDIDSSSSMWSNNDIPGPKRMDSAKTAAHAFTTAMLTPEPTGNWIGLDSFGYNKKDNPPLLSPQTDYSLVQNKIDLLKQGNNPQGMVESIVDSINNLTNTQATRPQDKVRAVIVLKDTSKGGNNAGIPAMTSLAQSTTPKTMVFTVYYNDGQGTAAEQEDLINIATGTGGQFFMATNSAELTKAFTDIAGILKTAAGVDASMNLNFHDVEVDGVSMLGDDVFSYVFVGPVDNMNSTIVSPDSVFGRTRIFWPNSSHSVIDQSPEWDLSQMLHFNIGTLNISERWNTTYRLRADQVGQTCLFNSTTCGSTMSYGGSPTPVCLPDLCITVTPNQTAQEPQGTLDVSNLIVTSSTIGDSIPLQWNLKYTGNTTATEVIEYEYNGRGTYLNPRPGYEKGEYIHKQTLNIKNFPPGIYKIYVHAFADDAPDALDGPIEVNITRANPTILLS